MNQEDILDRLRLQIFQDHKVSALFGALLCNLEWKWSDEIPTAATNYKKIIFNFDWFSSLPKHEQLAVALHEMHHVLRLHDIRQNGRDPKMWNYACDYVINKALKEDGYRLPSGALQDPQMMIDNNIVSEEDLYDFLMKNRSQLQDKPLKSFGHPDEDGDMQKGGADGDGDDGQSAADIAKMTKDLIDAVSASIAQAKMQDSKQAGQFLGSIEQHINSFLNPVVPWNQALRKYFIEVGGNIKRDWSRRNRRIRNVYMPKRTPDRDALTKVMFFLDTSGSTSDEELTKYVSEIKYVQENLNPLELQIIQFDYGIQKVDVYRQGDRIQKLDIKGRGGTSLDEVRELIVKDKPAVAVIFSDLECSPMEDPNVPVIWITPKTPYSWEPNYGTQYFIK